MARAAKLDTFKMNGPRIPPPSQASCMTVNLHKATMKVKDRAEVTVTGEGAKDLHTNGYYGELDGENLKLSPVEALYLTNRNRLEVRDESEQPQDFRSLLYKLAPDSGQLWTDFLVYSDLRDRGYIVRPGFTESGSFRLYKRGTEVGEEAAKFLVYVLAEGKPITIERLSEIAHEVRTLRKEPIFAVVDSQGDLTYYSMTATDLRKT